MPTHSAGNPGARHRYVRRTAGGIISATATALEPFIKDPTDRDRAARAAFRAITDVLANKDITDAEVTAAVELCRATP